MARKRRRFTAEFKGRVVLEALRERESVQAIAARHELHPNQVSAWKRQLLDAVPEVFVRDEGRQLAKHMRRRSTTCTRRSDSSRSSAISFGARSDPEPGGADADDRAGRTAEPVEAVRCWA